MVELVDNLLQLVVTLVAMGGAGLLFYKTRKQPYFLFTCFLGTMMLGVLYWVCYLLIRDYTPEFFYVSDLTWIASFLFLLILVISIRTPEEARFRHKAAWLSPVIGFGLMLLYYRYGDYVTNTLWCGFTAAAGWFSINGFLCARRQDGKARDRQYFHLIVLIVIILEFAVWTASCFWVSDTLTNPYFWFDFMLTAGFASLLPALKKAVDA